MTDVHSQSADSIGAGGPADDMEITPAMLAAGVAAFEDRDMRVQRSRDVVEDIFTAMIEMQRRPGTIPDGFKMPEASQPAFLRRSAAAAYVRNVYGIPCTPQWLAKLAVIGGGPFFRYSGRLPLYEPAKLDAWINERVGPPVRSTAERATP